MTSPVIHIHIRLFSFCPAYFVSEKKEEINTYLDDIYLDIPPYAATVDCSFFVLCQKLQNHGKNFLEEMVHRRLEQLPLQNRDRLTY